MPDNIVIDPGTTPSQTVATDDAGAGGHVQLFKIAYSADGDRTLVGADVNGIDVDVVRVIPGTSATSLGKAEDAAHASGDTGVMLLGVRNDVASALATTDGDYIPLTTDSAGRLYTTVSGLAPGSAAASLGKAEDAAHTSGDVGVFALGVRNDTLADQTSTDGDYGALAIDSKGRLQIIATPGGASITKNEDIGHNSGDTGIAVWTVRKDTATQLAGTDADYAPFITDANGRLHCIDVLSPTASGGYSVHRTVCAGTTNATSVKASAGQVYGWYISNANAAARYFKLYNKASAPTVGSDTPFMTIAIPGNGACTVNWAHGIAMGTGIAWAITTGATDADTGAVTANENLVNLTFT